MLSGFLPPSLQESLFYSRELMAPGWWGNVLKRYCTVPLLIVICSSSPITALNHSADHLPISCSTNETTVIKQLPEWEYRGCYADESSSRLLHDAYNGSENMTATTCVSFCSGQGYAFSGPEFSYQCWCGNALDPRAVPADQSNCNYACCADSSVACGGAWFISIYEARPSPSQTANATDNSGPSPMQTPNVTDYSGNHSNNATQNGGNNSSNTTNDGGNNSQTSNNITLGTSIGIGVPGLILSAVLVKMKFSKRGRNPRQVTSRPSTKASSIHSRYTESISPT